MKVLRSAVLMAGLAFASVAGAVGTETVTCGPSGMDATRCAIVWTSDAAGAVSGSLGLQTGIGYLFQIEIVPGSGGVQPSAAYDITLLDAYGVNLLVHGVTDAGANLSNTAPSAVQVFPAYYHDGTAGLELTVANAGNAKSGTVVMLFRSTP